MTAPRHTAFDAVRADRKTAIQEEDLMADAIQSAEMKHSDDVIQLEEGNYYIAHTIDLSDPFCGHLIQSAAATTDDKPVRNCKSFEHASR